jgi:hypothetical protein
MRRYMKSNNMYNKQKEFLIDLDIACGKIIEKHKVISFDKLWELLPMKYKLVGIRWYVEAKYNDFIGK